MYVYIYIYIYIYIKYIDIYFQYFHIYIYTYIYIYIHIYIYIYIYIYAYIYIYICIYIYVYKWSYVIHDTQGAQISQKQDEWNLYGIMKTMYTLGYGHNNFVVTHASCAQVHELPQSHLVITGRAHCIHDCIYIYNKEIKMKKSK